MNSMPWNLFVLYSIIDVSKHSLLFFKSGIWLLLALG